MKRMIMLALSVAGVMCLAQTNGGLLGENFTCNSYDFETGNVSGCTMKPGANLDSVVGGILKYERIMQVEHTKCGGYSDWVLDQNGNVMYRLPNGSCPKHPKPKGYGNYTADDIAAIGRGGLSEGSRPRTLR